MPAARLRLILLNLLCAAVAAPLGHGQTSKPRVTAPTARTTPAAASAAPTVATNTARRVVPQDNVYAAMSGPEVRQNAQLPTVYAPTRPRVGQPVYPWKMNIVTTIFWIGEPSTGVTAACNTKSSWDPNWQVNFGGFDDPSPAARTWDFRPKTFEPKQNPFYVALPFNDITNKGLAASVIPWFKHHPNRGAGTVCKSQWIAIRFGKKICYAQWEDCGPFETDDWAYVFGRNPQPKTVMNNGAGLDVSPAVRDYLGIVSGVRCDWRFCDVREVPDGPWRRFGANNPFVKSKDAELQERIKRMDELYRQRDAWLKNSYNPSLGY